MTKYLHMARIYCIPFVREMTGLDFLERMVNSASSRSGLGFRKETRASVLSDTGISILEPRWRDSYRRAECMAGSVLRVRELSFCGRPMEQATTVIGNICLNDGYRNLQLGFDSDILVTTFGN